MSLSIKYQRTGLTALLLAAWSVAGCTHPSQRVAEAPSVDKPAEVVPETMTEPATLEDAMERLALRDEWTDHPTLNLPRHPAQKYLKDWAIVIDPGHGGHADQAGYKRGPSGVREAEMNLRVARLLKELLLDAGAQVILTRYADEASSLEDRANIANTLVRDRDGVTGADLFLSVHHNLSPKDTTNWSSVWFHGDPNDSEVGIDAGRYIAHRVGEALRTQVALTSPLMTDRQMYAGGFGILRSSEVPACLMELSFYSNPDEEQRLRDGLYNLREAYAIYAGLCEYAYGGRPTQDLPTLSPSDETLTLSTVLSDGLPEGWWGHEYTRTFHDSIAVHCNGNDLPVEYDPATKQLVVDIPLTMLDGASSIELKLRHCNFFKHANWPQRYAINHVDDQWSIEPLPAKRIEGDVKAGGS